MARLVVNPGFPSAWEIQLKPGVNRLGRGTGNDFTITDPSVSGAHCQITVSDQGAVIKDLNSTNGTFVNRAKVQESALQNGQRVHLGGIEMVYHTDASGAAPVVAKTGPAPVAVVAPVKVVVRPVAAPVAAPVAPIALAAPVAAPAPVATPVALPPPVAAAPVAAEDQTVVMGGKCKFHPKTAGRYRCSQCGQFFCELCVTTRAVGQVQQKFCRHCGVACVPVQAPTQYREVGQKGFFARVPEAFIYPFRGSGVLILIAGTLLFAALNWFSGGLRYGLLPRAMGWSLIIFVFATGYLFAYMQNILHSTAAGDRELPDLPGMGSFLDDVLIPCLQLLGLVLICFGPAVAAGWWMLSSEDSALGKYVFAAFLAGCVYFPMAFLAVAMLDSVFAANPLQVVPSMLKVPLEYIATLILLTIVLGIRFAGDELLPELFPRGLATHNMAKLFGYLGVQAVWSVASLYLLTVNVRILGLLYVTKKEKLGWFGR